EILAGLPTRIEQEPVVVLSAASIQTGDGAVGSHVGRGRIGQLQQASEILSTPAAVGLKSRALSKLSGAGRAGDYGLPGKPDRGVQIHPGPDVGDFRADV